MAGWGRDAVCIDATLSSSGEWVYGWLRMRWCVHWCHCLPQESGYMAGWGWDAVCIDATLSPSGEWVYGWLRMRWCVHWCHTISLSRVGIWLAEGEMLCALMPHCLPQESGYMAGWGWDAVCIDGWCHTVPHCLPQESGYMAGWGWDGVCIDATVSLRRVGIWLAEMLCALMPQSPTEEWVYGWLRVRCCVHWCHTVSLRRVGIWLAEGEMLCALMPHSSSGEWVYGWLRVRCCVHWCRTVSLRRVGIWLAEGEMLCALMPHSSSGEWVYGWLRVRCCVHWCRTVFLRRVGIWLAEGEMLCALMPHCLPQESGCMAGWGWDDVCIDVTLSPSGEHLRAVKVVSCLHTILKMAEICFEKK